MSPHDAEPADAPIRPSHRVADAGRSDASTNRGRDEASAIGPRLLNKVPEVTLYF